MTKGDQVPRRSSYRLRLKCDGGRAETRFRLSAKRTSPFNSAGASVQSTTGSRGVRINGSDAGYTMFRSSVKSSGYQLHSPVSPSLPLPCVTMCHHISTGVYFSVYKAIGICHALMLTGCWQDRDGVPPDPVNSQSTYRMACANCCIYRVVPSDGEQ